MKSQAKLNDFTVEVATATDIPGILAVLEENLLINKDKSAVGFLEESGFLIARHSVDDLLHWIEDRKNHIVLVCKQARKVIGYTMGCNLKVLPVEMRDKFEEIESLKGILASCPVLYHKQIAIKSDRKGVGTIKFLRLKISNILMQKPR